MGMLYGAQIQTMMPKLHSTNFEGMELIRPLYLVRKRISFTGHSTMTCISFSVPVVLPKGVHPVEEQKKGQREQM